MFLKLDLAKVMMGTLLEKHLLILKCFLRSLEFRKKPLPD